MPAKEKKAPRGRTVVAQALKSQGVEYVFGVVGYPIIELGFEMQALGIKYIGMRNEQAASYAAGAVGYLTGRPGCCLVVPGPGMVHALAGMGNSSVNAWPMICIAGSSELGQDGLGAFQESLPPQGGAQNQVMMPWSVCKYAAKCTEGERIPYMIEQAVRYSVMGRPGAVYVEIAGDTLRDRVNGDVYYPPICPNPPLVPALDSEIQRALACLASAKSPLLIVGKGAAYADAAPELTEFVSRTGIPFLPTPMGKGVLPDDHPLCSSPARSGALKGADVILLVGARLNWILHYGRPPRFQRGVKVIHVELLPEEIGHSIPAEVALVGHAKAISGQLVAGLSKTPVKVPADSPWIAQLEADKKKSQATFAAQAGNRSTPMNYYCALGIINKHTPKDAIIMNEGSDTMDIGRTVLNNYLPRKRLDAATWGTMGVGLGQTIASALVCSNPGCVAVMGDSAFGFSGMEFEVVCRLELPVIIVIINNNGIGAQNPTDYMGLAGTEKKLQYPAKSLTPSCHYEGIAEAFGAKGVFCTTADELEAAFMQAVAIKPFKPTLINCMINTSVSRAKEAAPPFAKSTL
jgi:2-hydroxyacyl-CoA lyase 1